MARPQDKPTFPTVYDEEAGGCGCFRRFCFGWDDVESRSYLLQERQEGVAHKEAWIVARLKKLRELSEVLAGPKWKNLIRRIGKICKLRRHNKSTLQFQYSPESYALNFAGDDEEEDEIILHSFSVRFAPGFALNDQHKKPALSS
ncbi:uncharacterized protein LOC105166496 [Sesamum indicum]|uniref:Uncharacterized protein LOC105166496 n=1 Tax=Sesamum indicum TaxID=4182 RepID=A0A6I9TGM9_SESIN|nr:uncharacterized protein LOC105166496 [Sesamum indicum]